MLAILPIACALVAVTVTIHVAGIGVLLSILRRRNALARTRFWPIIRLMLFVTWCLLFVHLAEILVWGAFYVWWGCLPDAEAAIYFSAVTYTTIGYGDVVLALPWRMLAPIEGLTGILMCGLSTSVFFAVVLRIVQLRHAPTN